MTKLSTALFLLLAMTTSASAAAPNLTTITWHGHAAFEITAPNGKVIFIDPWLQNPTNKAGKQVLDTAKADYIVVTHGHSDHVGDTVALGKRTGAKLVANFDLASNMVRLLGYPEKQAGYDTLTNPGGEIAVDDGAIVFQLTGAVHSSGLDVSADGKGAIAYGGNPTGVVIKLKNGPTIYHTGDTAFFKDMELIGEHTPADVALLNIGGHFGMEPKMAVKAAQAVKAKLVVPHHYKTFPILTQSSDEFGKWLSEKKIGLKALEVGASIVFDGTKPKN